MIDKKCKKFENQDIKNQLIYIKKNYYICSIMNKMKVICIKDFRCPDGYVFLKSNIYTVEYHAMNSFMYVYYDSDLYTYHTFRNYLEMSDYLEEAKRADIIKNFLSEI
jgi:hypothetical protein